MTRNSARRSLSKMQQRGGGESDVRSSGFGFVGVEYNADHIFWHHWSESCPMRVLNPTFPANRPLVISYNPILNRKEAETAFSLGGGWGCGTLPKTQTAKKTKNSEKRFRIYSENTRQKQKTLQHVRRFWFMIKEINRGTASTSRKLPLPHLNICVILATVRVEKVFKEVRHF